ncbi:unnamed protein product [Effrenium voratum]|nr:unnamed protein product [Effrenium voratum]
MIENGMSCQIVNYVKEEHDLFFKVLERFDGVIVRCNPGQITADGGDQNKFDESMMKLSKKIPVWPTADVMRKMGAKDALCKIKHMDFGLPDTIGYYSPEDFKTGFPKTIAFHPRVVKQNRGSAGEGIWIVKLKSEAYCEEPRVCSMDAPLLLMEANDNHVEEHTVAEFIEFCVNGRTEKSGTWSSQGSGKYFEAGGQMVDQRYLPGIKEGESRFFMVGKQLYNVEHYVYHGGVGGETETTVYPPDAPQYAETKMKLEGEVEDYLEVLGLDMDSLPLLWAVDFIPIKDHKFPLTIGEFNCSCLGISAFLSARGGTLSQCSVGDIAAGQNMCNFIGEKAREILDIQGSSKHSLPVLPIDCKLNNSYRGSAELDGGYFQAPGFVAVE